jgi:MSHA biogenesis protein MshL
MRRFVISCVVPILAACSVPQMPHDTSVQSHIQAELQQAAAPKPKAATPPPAAVTDSLLPPLRSTLTQPVARESQQRFNLKVTDAPIGQVLLAIVQDTPYSVLLSPRAAGPGAPTAPDKLTVNLKDVTVFEALDAVREIYGYEYTVDGTRIYVTPPEMRTKLYQVNYVIGQRRGVSDVQVIGGASSSSANTSGTTGGAGTTGSMGTNGQTGGSYASIQASALSSMSRSDVWSEMEDSLRTILGCTIASTTPARSAAAAGGGGSASTNSSSGNSSRADVSFNGEAQAGTRQRGVEGCPGGRALTVSTMSGTIVVRAMPAELRQIESLLRSMQLNIERQVVIEAKVVDVELNSGSQQGVNWSALRGGLFRGGVGVNPGVIGGGTNGRGLINNGDSTTGPIPATMTDVLGTALIGVSTPNAFTAGLGMAFQNASFSALINFLETQGRVQVLSSPRISTLNNQKAVIKVGAEESFVTNISGGTSTVTNGAAQVTPPTLMYQPFFSGISLDVTPQIDESDNITLHVRTMVNSITEKEKLSLPAANAARVPFAVNSISETDSVVKTRDGQVVVIGGLMTESTSDNRARVPLAGDVPVLGAMFGRGDRQSSKRELVILLKPTVVKGDDSWAGEINAAQGRIERLNAPPARPALQ